MASTHQISVGGVKIGGGAPVVVQSMTLTKTHDVEATVGQIAELASAGCEVVRCAVCGHGSLLVAPAADAVARAYADAADPVSVREEAGQVQTAQRALEEVERFVTPGLVCDIGCWTGSLLVAARERGWRTVGVEPSSWASQRARDRGLDVRTGDLDAHGLEPATVCEILQDENAADFRFDEEGFHWGDLSASTSEIETARQNNVIAFGSCSFDEPRDGLAALKLLGRA